MPGIVVADPKIGLEFVGVDGFVFNGAVDEGMEGVALSQASVVSDDQGSVRLQKKLHGRSRDDVAVCGVLSAEALVRHLQGAPRARWRYRGAA